MCVINNTTNILQPQQEFRYVSTYLFTSVVCTSNCETARSA